MNYTIFYILMDEYIKGWCKYLSLSFDEVIQKYNSNIKTGYWSIDGIIDYKIKNNKDVIYKEDIPKIHGLSQEEFMEKVIEEIEFWYLDINNLTIKDCHNNNLRFYHISTFLDNEPVDIKIALKD